MNLLHLCDVILWPKQKSGIGPESALYCIYTKPFSLVFEFWFFCLVLISIYSSFYLIMIFNKPKKIDRNLTLSPSTPPWQTLCEEWQRSRDLSLFSRNRRRMNSRLLTRFSKPEKASINYGQETIVCTLPADLFGVIGHFA